MSYIFLLAMSVATALADVRVRGRVLDSEGRAMEMVNIRVKGKSVIGTMSNFKGEYEIRVPESDSLSIVFTCLGYKRVTRTLNTSSIKADQFGQKWLGLSVTMHDNESVLGDVEVVATRQQTTNEGLERLNVADVGHMRSTSGNAVEDMIGTMAGVTMNNELSSQYSVRGGSFDENLVYVNGIEIYRPQLVKSGQQEGLSFINPMMVSDVNFSTGGFSAAYGDKMSSVLDVTYRRPERFEAEAELNFMGGSLAIGHRNKGFTALHGIRYRRNAQLLSSLDTKGEYDPRYLDYQLFMTQRVNQNWDMSLMGNIQQNDYRFAPKDRETSFGTSTESHTFKVYFDGQEKDRFTTLTGAYTLNYRGIKGTTLSLMASAMHTEESITYDIQGEYWMDEAVGLNQLNVGRYKEHARNRLKASVLAVSLRGETQLGHNRLAYGVTVQSEKINDFTSEWERRDSSGYTLPYSPDKPLAVLDNQYGKYDATTTRISGFVQDTYGWDTDNGRFLLTGGVRVSHWSMNKETLVSPRLSLRFTPGKHPGVVYRLQGGIYYQAPFYKEYKAANLSRESSLSSPSSIKSQRSWQVIAGTDITFQAMQRPFRFTVEAYYKGISNYNPYLVDNMQIRYKGYNTGTAYNYGLDMKLYGSFVVGADSWLSLSLMQSRETYEGLTTSRPTEQRYAVSLFFSDYIPGHEQFRFYLRGVFNDGLPFAAPRAERVSGTFRTPAYKRVDLGASHVWSARSYRFMRRGAWRKVQEMHVGLDVFNLLDIENVNSYYWISADDNRQYAVPNYLTSRQLSLNLGIKF